MTAQTLQSSAVVGSPIWAGHSLELLPECSQQPLPCVLAELPWERVRLRSQWPRGGWKRASHSTRKVHLCKGHDRSAALHNAYDIFQGPPSSLCSSPIGLPVKLQQKNNYTLSRSCPPVFQACVANWKYKMHWWTVSVLTSKETEFSKAVLICLGQHQDNLFIQRYASHLLSENFSFPYIFKPLS